MASNLKKYYDEYDKQNKSTLNSQIATVQSTLEKNRGIVNENYGAKIKETEQSYDDQHRINAVQKLINEQDVAESMANSGLTNSGLNRTQQTAVQLSYANNRASLDRQRLSAVDALTREMNAYLTEIDTNAQTQIASLKDTYAQNKNSYAQELYKADKEAETQRLKDQQEYNLKLLQQQQTVSEKNLDTQSKEREKLYSHLQNYNNDPDYAAQMIDVYCAKYNINPDTQSGRAELVSLLKAADIEFEEFENYIENASIYSTAAQYNSGNTKGRTVWNYKTDGKQKYKIEVVKDTWNLLGGVDGNAVVNIYYADGTPLATNVKLGKLTRSVGKEISKLTKGSGNKGKTATLSLDLSNEDLG